ncbi:MAG: hypothetical protein AB1348_02490 [Nitrospirota bacterium]
MLKPSPSKKNQYKQLLTLLISFSLIYYSPAFAGYEESPGEKVVHTGEGKETKGDERTSLIERLGTIELRRQELAKQREQLEKEKQALDEEIKAEGRLTYKRTARELTSKQNMLNEKINEFNKEVESLEKEEKEIHERLNTMK